MAVEFAATNLASDAKWGIDDVRVTIDNTLVFVTTPRIAALGASDGRADATVRDNQQFGASNYGVWVAGSSNRGQLGNGVVTTQPAALPNRVTGLSWIQQLSGGDSHFLALGFDGMVKAWGSNEHGALGNTSSSPPDGTPPTPWRATGGSIR